MQHTRGMTGTALPALRKPDAKDGADIWELVRSCQPLDENSMYCNLIQCDHFRDTCVVAELDGETVGWVSGYILPHDPDTLFIWQVAVAEQARGMGLGAVMLQNILARDVCEDVERVQTTITGDNAASWALFRKFAGIKDAELTSQPYFTQALHFRDLHKTENMVTISLKNRMRAAA
ncbi:L-2,4-diaminobutyric acid acetyltransferase [Thalassovita gelatinovora]|uniref:L-2,4-diaminobutyric acid acetyltransferase n=1 Tax=Thalassovita gelatinovora TaxID=53501 RepID=A0A0P1FZK0_THAGE|nr:diaminobutyrate acetyltransferase [Thalassovita gelatinovora]QIZ79817.1 diaminobutyrate acetyltransferase [Thalassovita gelatinovora]CUH66877.1 L-2,4-diaminobutyric acid acetyltransferase [Thalassovita gelatinovora]SEQ44353.1 diaminobutyrate acetyltransferase [Thalassovita gelatinovora]